MRYFILISKNVKNLKGKGEEWLLSHDGEYVIAKFYDGNIIVNPSVDRTVITLVPQCAS